MNVVDKKHLAELRDRQLSIPMFRRNIHHFGARLYAHAIDEFHVRPDDLYAIAVMRAGFGLLNGALMNNYQGDIGFIDAKRHEKTWVPKISMFKCQANMTGSTVLMFETMLATGGSLALCTSLVKEHVRPRRIIALNLLSAPEGLHRMQNDHPDVEILTAYMDPCLDKKGYIVPGLGDAGDRYYGPFDEYVE